MKSLQINFQSYSVTVNEGNFQSEIALGGVICWGSFLQESFTSVGLHPEIISMLACCQTVNQDNLLIVLEGKYRFNGITFEGQEQNIYYHWYFIRFTLLISLYLTQYLAKPRTACGPINKCEKIYLQR
ncbi:MAG: hypothetical protein ACI87J_002049 [Colwellia sp.]|jgi:hypothetical protein